MRCSWAIGRDAVVDDIGLERAGVALDAQGYIGTDKFQVTNVPGIYAIGDVTGRVQLTPVAIAAGAASVRPRVRRPARGASSTTRTSRR